MLKKMVVTTGLFFILAATASAQNTAMDSLKNVLKSQPDNVDAGYKLAVLYHDAIAATPDDAMAKDAEDLFKKILKTKPDHVQAMGYYGSLLTLKARDAMNPLEKLDFVQQGCDKMDKALQFAPNDIHLRLLRAMNSVNLPPMLNRLSYALKDFQFLRNSPAFAHLGPDLQQEIFYFSGVAFLKADRDSKARKMFKKAVDVNAENKWGKMAHDKLAKK